jgi:glycine cleavage system aminomethyltransferase T
MSLALAYLDRDVVASNEEVTVYVVGDPRTARILPEIPYDPSGAKLRDHAVSVA